VQIAATQPRRGTILALALLAACAYAAFAHGAVRIPDESWLQVADDVAALAASLRDAGLAASCEVDLEDADLVEPVLATGVGAALVGPESHPAARVLLRADEPGAEARCRSLADRDVRLVRGRPVLGGQGADLAFVRCLGVLMAGAGHPAIAATDPRLIAIAGERAAWTGRPSDTWEYVLPYGALTDERRRLVASGCTVRVSVRVGRSRS